MRAREDLIQELETAFDGLERSIHGLSPEQMLQPWYDGWTVRDILGHIVGWQQVTQDVLERIARNERPVPEGVDYNDSDAWNAHFAGVWSHETPEAVIAELGASQARFVAAARQVPEERLQEGRTAHRALTGNGTHHYLEHAPAIQAWRQREGI